MGRRNSEIQDLLREVKGIITRLKIFEERYAEALAQVHPRNQASALNLVHYMALRSEDIRSIQIRLGELGVSRMGRAEGHVMASLYAVQHTLKCLAGRMDPPMHKAHIGIKKGRKLLARNVTALLGAKRKGSRTRIMVTLPSHAGDDRTLVPDLVKAGMSIARVNCSHDTPVEWRKMVAKVRQAQRASGKAEKIAMDLGGPKLRTGSLAPGPKVVRLRPKRDLLGRIAAEPRVWLSPEDKPEASYRVYTHLPVEAPFLRHLDSGAVVRFRDTRGKNCRLTVYDTESGGAWAHCDKSAYVETGTTLTLAGEDGAPTATVEVGELPPRPQAIVLKPGDALEITRDPAPGTPAHYGSDQQVLRPARISCQVPEIFEELRPGESIMLDDGKLEGVIRQVDEDCILVEVVRALGGAFKLKAEKGINLPESALSLSGLTRKDRQDLRFAAEHADIVSLSFVNSASDVRELCDALDEVGADQMGIVLKIETVQGFKKLPEILLAAMRRQSVGVMIARGDLAIESGWQNLARVQEEILWMCEAAHVPIIWATQVLESLAKSGQPSRAEISDVSVAERAECVMLNKGPHIIRTVTLLSDILQSMEDYQDKKAPLLPVWRIRNEQLTE